VVGRFVQRDHFFLAPLAPLADKAEAFIPFPVCAMTTRFSARLLFLSGCSSGLVGSFRKFIVVPKARLERRCPCCPLRRGGGSKTVEPVDGVLAVRMRSSSRCASSRFLEGRSIGLISRAANTPARPSSTTGMPVTRQHARNTHPRNQESAGSCRRYKIRVDGIKKELAV
jgi:hypothetical protein